MAAGDGVVMSKHHVAASIGSTVAIVDLDTGDVHRWGQPGSELFSNIVADDDGHFLVAAQRAYALDMRGHLAWEAALPKDPPVMDEWVQCRLAYRGATQTLVAGCNNGYLSGIQTRGGDARVTWSRHLYEVGTFDMSVGPGRADQLVVSLGSSHESSGTWLLDATTGAQQAMLPRGTGGVFSATKAGFLLASPELTLIDNKARQQWQLKTEGVYQMPVTLGDPDDRLLVMERSAAESSRLSMYSLATQKRIAGPVGHGTPVAAGADGTYYAYSCDVGSREELSTPPQLVAYDKDLHELWKHELLIPGMGEGKFNCPRPGVALDKSGVMYLLVEATGTYLMAVQTNSPGPADSLWSLRLGNNQGWRWVE